MFLYSTRRFCILYLHIIFQINFCFFLFYNFDFFLVDQSDFLLRYFILNLWVNLFLRDADQRTHLFLKCGCWRTNQVINQTFSFAHFWINHFLDPVLINNFPWARFFMWLVKDVLTLKDSNFVTTGHSYQIIVRTTTWAKSSDKRRLIGVCWRIWS